MPRLNQIAVTRVTLITWKFNTFENKTEMFLAFLSKKICMQKLFAELFSNVFEL